MKDNYPVSGKTYTPGSGMLDQERNPIIGVNTRTVTRTTAATSCTHDGEDHGSHHGTDTVLTTPATVQTTLPRRSLPNCPATAATATTKSPGFESVVRRRRPAPRTGLVRAERITRSFFSSALFYLPRSPIPEYERCYHGNKITPQCPEIQAGPGRGPRDCRCP